MERMDRNSVPQDAKRYKCVGCGFEMALEPDGICYTCRLIAEADAAGATPEQIARNSQLLGGSKACAICAGHGVDNAWGDPVPCPNCRPEEWRTFNALTTRPRRPNEMRLLDNLDPEARRLAREQAERLGVSVAEAVRLALREAAEREGLV
jgi:hypothetical protein